MKLPSLIFFGLCCIVCWAQPLIKDGKSSYCIVVSPEAILAEQNAARELQLLLKEMSGVELAITSSATGPALRVGQSAEAAAALGIADWSDLQPDEILVATVGDDLYCVGDRPRGTLYAVYELLERAFGVRFWTAAVTDVPSRRDLEVPEVFWRYAPPVQVRAAGYDLARLDPRFAARTRNNGHGTEGTPAEWGDSVPLLGGVHTFSDNMPLIAVDKYQAEHPEWFSERGGERRSHHVQLCLSNPELRLELVNNVLAALRANPMTRYISVSQNDNQNFCQCAACNAFVAAHGNQSDLLIDAINQVAQAVAAEFPGVYVETLAYNYTRIPPETIRPDDNVIVRYCTIEEASFHPLQSAENQALAADLEGWRAMAKQLMIWHYVTNFTKYYQPHPNWRVLAPDLRFFRDCGAISIYDQGSWNGGGELADLGDLRAWVTSKLLWNPDLNAEELIEEFIVGYYGPGADYVRGYLNAMLASLDRHPEQMVTCYSHSTAGWLDVDVLIDAWMAMEAGVRKLAADPVYGPRLAIASVPINAALLERSDAVNALKASTPAFNPERQLAETLNRMHLTTVSILTEGGVSPDEWAHRLMVRSQLASGTLADDGEVPAAWKKSGAHAWNIERIANLHALENGLWLDADAAAIGGRAVRMPNTHNEWHLQVPFLPAGSYDLYFEVRCDSETPSGDALRVGTYDWRQKLELGKDIPAQEIAGGEYRLIEFGRIESREDFSIFVAPIVNAAVKNVWIDRILFVPRP